MSDPIFELSYEVDDQLFIEVRKMWLKLLNTAKRQSRFGRFIDVAVWAIFFLIVLGMFQGGLSPKWFLAFFAGYFLAIMEHYFRIGSAEANIQKELLLRRHQGKPHGNKTRVVINAHELIAEDSDGRSCWSWNSINQIYVLEHGTAVLRGVHHIIIPNDALPNGLTPDAFRARLEDLKAAQ